MFDLMNCAGAIALAHGTANTEPDSMTQNIVYANGKRITEAFESASKEDIICYQKAISALFIIVTQQIEIVENTLNEQIREEQHSGNIENEQKYRAAIHKLLNIKSLKDDIQTSLLGHCTREINTSQLLNAANDETYALPAPN